MPLFQEISELPNVDIKVYFGRYRSSPRKWKVNLNVGFDFEVLRELKALRVLFGPGNSINPSLLLRLLSEKFDVYMGGAPFYFGTIVTFLAAKMLRKPFILFLEDVDHPVVAYRSRLESFLSLPFSRKLIEMTFFIIRSTFAKIVLKYSDAHVAPGTATKEYLLRRGVTSSKIFIAVNAIDNEYFEQKCKELKRKKAPRRLKKRMGLEGKKVVLYAGYLQERKGVQYLITAFARLRRERNNVALVIVGNGPYRRELSNACEENGVDAIFPGYVPDPDLIIYYLMADVFVLPTLSDVWGFVINEAMICGCPIITTTNSGASRDLVKNGINGYIVKPGSVLELYRALKKITSNTYLRKEMGKKSREIVKDFCYNKSVEGFKLAIERVAGIDMSN